MAYLHGLVVDGLGPRLVGVAQGADPDAGGKVNIFLSLGIPEGRPLAVVDGNLVSSIGLEDIALVEGFDFIEIHR